MSEVTSSPYCGLNTKVPTQTPGYGHNGARMIECNRTMEQARRDFSAGRLKGAVLVRVPMSGSEWTVRLTGAKGDAGMLLEVQTLGVRVFRSLDAAAAAIEQIGFSFDQLDVK